MVEAYHPADRIDAASRRIRSTFLPMLLALLAALAAVQLPSRGPRRAVGLPRRARANASAAMRSSRCSPSAGGSHGTAPGHRSGPRPRRLRTLNDALGDADCRALIPYASAAVGTGADAGTRQRRLERCRRELEAIDFRRSRVRRMLAPLPAVPSPSSPGKVLERFGSDVLIALQRAARPWRPRALTLADELIAIRPVLPPAGASRDARRRTTA